MFLCSSSESKVLREMFRRSRTAWGSGITEGVLADYLGMERAELRHHVDALIRRKLVQPRVLRAYGNIPPLVRLTEVADRLLAKRVGTAA